MSKVQRDGLLLDNTIFIIDERKPGLPIQTRIFQLIAILLGSWGSISTLLETIAIPANKGIVYLTILICAILVFGLCMFPSYDLVKLFFGILCYGLFFLSRLKPMENGFYILENKIIERLSAYYDISFFQYIFEDKTAVKDATLIAVMLIIPLVALFTVAIVRNRLTGIAGILLFLPITVSFVFGLIPSERYLIAYVAAVLYLSQASVTNHHIKGRKQRLLLHRINSRAAIWLCVICLCVFALLKLFITKDDYQEIDEIKETKTKIQKALFEFNINDYTSLFENIHIFHTQPVVGGLDGGKLGNYSEVKFTKAEQLVISAPLESISEGVYLKGYVGSDYTGHSWEKHSEDAANAYSELIERNPEDERLIRNQAAKMFLILGQITDGVVYRSAKMEVEYKKANRQFVYLPYFTDIDQQQNVSLQQDLYALPDKRNKTYSAVYYSMNPNSSYTWQMWLLDSYGLLNRNEMRYRRFVYDYYTRMPDTGLERVKRDFGDRNMELTALNVNEKINYVIDYLDANTEYSLAPGKLPKGKDYIEYFLYENQKGYCAHYATAAVMMLRAMDVPARYVEGYAVGPSDVIRNTVSSTRKDIPSFQINNPAIDVKVSVKDYNAHAWIEVYIDGFGWFPFDPTPGSSIGLSGWDERDSQAGATTPAPTKPPATPTPRPTQAPRHNEPEVTKAPVTAAGKDGSQTTDQPVSVASILVLLILSLLLLIAMLLAYQRSIRRRRKVRTPRQNNRKAILIFRNTSKILSHLKELSIKGESLEDCEEYVKKHCLLFEQTDFKNFMEIIKKARFSKETISKSELDEVRWFYRNLVTGVYDGLSIGMKLYLRLNRPN